jgi:hypothetical protein
MYRISHQSININNCFVETSVILTFFDQNSGLLQEVAHLSRNKAEHVEYAHQQMTFLFKNHIKIYIKIDINIDPACFGLRPSSGSLH